MGTQSFVVADSTVSSSSGRREPMTSFSPPFSAGAAALQPGGASASGASGGLPSAAEAERAESFVATTESGDYDSDRGESESMLLYTKRCLEQYKKICADGLDADVPKEKFITRLLDGSGLDKDDQEECVNVAQYMDEWATNNHGSFRSWYVCMQDNNGTQMYGNHPWGWGLLSTDALAPTEGGLPRKVALPGPCAHFRSGHVCSNELL